MAVRWTVRRSRARRAVIAAIGLLVVLTTFLLTGIAGYSAHAGVEGLRDYLTAPGSGVALAMQTRLGDDPKAQQAAAESFFAKSFTGVDVLVYTSVTLPPQPVTATSTGGEVVAEGAPTVRMASFDDFAAHARITAGSWPDDPQPAAGDGPQPAALSASAATMLGLRVGDTLTLGTGSKSQVFRIDAVWEPATEGDPFFTADAAGARSPADLAADLAAAGFLVVPRPVVVARGELAQANWTVVPDPDTITEHSIPAMAAAAAAVPTAFRNPDRVMAPHGGLAVDNLSGPLLTVSQTLRAARSVNPVPSLLVAAIALVMTVQLARLLAIERRRETALIRSRGASAGQLTRIATTEAAAVAVPAAVVGAALAAVGLHLVGAPWPPSGWWIWLVVAAAAAVVMVVPAARQAQATANRQNIDDSGRIRALAAGSTVTLAVIAAAISLWRFRHLGAAAFVGADGTTHLDPIAVLAPALVLIAAAVVAGVVFGLAAALAEAVAARLRGIGTVLAARQIARRATVYGIAVLLLAISVGGTALAASYQPTQKLAQQQTDALRNGGSVQVQMPTVDPQIAADYTAPDTAVAALPGVSAAVPAIALVGGSLGTQPVDVTGIPTQRLGQVVASTVAVSTATIASALHTDLVGVAIPDGTSQLELTTAIAAAWADYNYVVACTSDESSIAPPEPGPSGQSVEIGLVAWVAGPDGWPAPVDAGAVTVPVDPSGSGTPQSENYRLRLPHLPNGSRLVGLYWTVPSTRVMLSISLRLERITAGAGGSSSTTLPLGRPQDWSVRPSLAPPYPYPCRIDNNSRLSKFTIQAIPDGIGASGVNAPETRTFVQLIPSATASTLPIAIDGNTAALLDLSVGDAATLAVGSGRQVAVTVAAISPALPGPGSAPKVLVDFAGLAAAMLAVSVNVPAPNQWWVMAEDPTAVAKELVSLVPANSVIQLADSRSAQALLVPASRTLWLGALGAVLLAAIGVGSVIAVVSRSRRGELVALRASGITARAQARSRRRELTSVALAGWILGAGVGILAALATIPGLAGSTIVGSFGATPPLRWDLSTAAWLVGAQIVAVAVVVIGHGIWLRRAVLRSTPSELQQ